MQWNVWYSKLKIESFSFYTVFRKIPYLRRYSRKNFSNCDDDLLWQNFVSIFVNLHLFHAQRHLCKPVDFKNRFFNSSQNESMRTKLTLAVNVEVSIFTYSHAHLINYRFGFMADWLSVPPFVSLFSKPCTISCRCLKILRVKFTKKSALSSVSVFSRTYRQFFFFSLSS